MSRLLRCLRPKPALAISAALAVALLQQPLAGYAQERSALPGGRNDRRIEIVQAPVSPSVDVSSACLSPAQLKSVDGDVSRNANALGGSDLCLRQQAFVEGGLHWILRIIQSKTRPHTYFWIVPHDNENDAFDSAVYAVTKYGGTVVAVEANGERTNGGQDPNRNFDSGAATKCIHQHAASPLYTTNVMSWYPPKVPIVALHNNLKNGNTSIFFTRTNENSAWIAYPAQAPISSKNPDHTLVFVASTKLPNNDGDLMALVQKLNGRGIHVIYEPVSSAHYDCSFSNYTALKDIKPYINIEVVHSDGATQKRMIDMVVGIIGKPAP